MTTEPLRPYSRYGYEPPVKSSEREKTVVYHTSGLGLYGVEHPVGITVRDLSSGNLVQLISRASGKCIRVNSRTLNIDGGGTNGIQAMFIVTNINNDDIVTLRCLANPAKFLVLTNGELRADGKGGPECRFRYRLVDGQYMQFESIYNTNRFISVYEKGEVKTPAPGKKRRKGYNSHFRVRLMGQSYQTYAN